MNSQEIEKMMTGVDLTETAPVSEPERQYYFMEKARRHVSELQKSLGRKPTFCVTTFGCQMLSTT